MQYIMLSMKKIVVKLIYKKKDKTGEMINSLLFFNNKKYNVC